MEANGVNGQVVFDGRSVQISRRGIIGFLSQGLKGDKRIPVSSITAVQFKAAGVFTNGYIQFSIHGGRESRAGIFAATEDENTVMFRAGQQEPFEQLRSAIEAAMAQAASGNAASISVADELKKLVELRDMGALTPAEFDAQKARLLGH